jgi:hypothetical protein
MYTKTFKTTSTRDADNPKKPKLQHQHTPLGLDVPATCYTVTKQNISGVYISLYSPFWG